MRNKMRFVTKSSLFEWNNSDRDNPAEQILAHFATISIKTSITHFIDIDKNCTIAFSL